MSAAETISKVGTGTKNLAVGLAVIAVMAALGYVGYKTYKGAQAVGKAAGAAVDAVGAAVNPAADTNLAYRAANSLIGCGDGSCSVGSRIADGVDAVRGWFH